MPLEIYRYIPDNDQSKAEEYKWRLGTVIYPGERGQLTTITSTGKVRFASISVRPDDSASVIEIIDPIDLIIRPKNSDKPSQILYREEDAVPFTLYRGDQPHDILVRWLIADANGNIRNIIKRRRLIHK